MSDVGWRDGPRLGNEESFAEFIAKLKVEGTTQRVLQAVTGIVQNL